MLICGASFAGLTVARELSGSGARVLMIDRYEIGERQTSACAAPTDVAAQPRPRGRDPPDASATSSSTPRGGRSAGRCRGLLAPSTTARCARCCARSRPAWSSRPPRSRRREGDVVRHRPRRADARRSSSTRSAGGACSSMRPSPSSRPRRACHAGWRSTRGAARDDLELWLDRATCRAGYGWSFPAGDEVRVGVGSFDPRDHVKDPTVRLAADLGVEPEGYQGNWIPHRMRPASRTASSSSATAPATACPTTAEGIRTALYFGLACGRELRAVLDGRSTRVRGARALRRVLRGAPARLRRAAERADAHRARQPAPARDDGGRPRDGQPPLPRLVLRALPAHRAARVRAGAVRLEPAGAVTVARDLPAAGVAGHDELVGAALRASSRRSSGGRASRRRPPWA